MRLRQQDSCVWRSLLYRFSKNLRQSPFTAPTLPAQDKAIDSLRETGKAFAAVARKVSPSVVYIQVEASAPAQPMVPPQSPLIHPQSSA